MFRTRLFSRAALMALLLALGAGAEAQSVNKVLVVVNDNSSVSTELGAYYVAARGIPAVNVCHVSTQNSAVLPSGNEIITYTNFINQIRTPILNYVAAHSLDIDYLVLTKGIPIRINPNNDGTNPPPPVTAGGVQRAAVDSMLAVSRDYPANPDLVFTDGTGAVVLKTWENRYWNATEPFSRAAYGGFIVTRLDGYTLANAKALVDRAQQALYLHGNWIFDIDPDKGNSTHAQPRNLTDPDYEVNYGDYNRDMIAAGQMLTARGVSGVLINDVDANFNPIAAASPNETFVGNMTNVAGYVSWGSNDGDKYTRALYNSNTFLPGSIAETAVSSSGRTLIDRSASGQSLIADLIEQGVTGCKGYVWEPYLDAVASPVVLFSHYTGGYNLAESFYAASRFVGWMDIVLGDPLARVAVRPPWDINGDGTTDDADLGLVLAHQGQCSPDPNYLLAADVNRDGCIDDADLGLVLFHQGE